MIESTDATELLQRIRGEFAEMPGLRLTHAQACRMWALDPTTCVEMLTSLIDAKFLFRTRDGAFMRVDGGTPLKASLRPRAMAVA